ncbi:Dynein axonemal assembly factor 4 [Durusdinium trenchii]|uniref:Protein unc-45 homolog B n=1 Tax=Durusdinium trenchii TaxID=1381693 RepID=A0ABP0HPJ4_9DINO
MSARASSTDEATVRHLAGEVVDKALEAGDEGAMTEALGELATLLGTDCAWFLDEPEEKETLRLVAQAAGVVPRMMKAMEAFDGSARVAAVACKVLRFVARVQDKEPFFRDAAECGMQKVIPDVLRKFPGEEDLQQWGCVVLAILADNDTLQVQLMESGAGKAINVAMRTHRASEAVQEQACSAIWALAAFRPDLQKALMALRVADDIVEAMRLHKASAALQDQACGALRSLAANPENQDELMELGVAADIMQAMRSFRGSAELQENACGGLANLARQNSSNQAKLIDGGAAKEVLHAMSLHSGIAEVQEFACAALRSFAASEAHQKKLMSLGAGDALCEAMRACRNRSRVQAEAIGAIQNLAAHDSNEKKLMALGVGTEIAEAMRKHSGSVEVQETACGALWNLTAGTENAKKLMALGVAPDLVEAMRNHLDHALVQEAAAGALRNMAWNKGKNRQVLRDLQVGHVVMKTMEVHMDDAAVLEICVDLMTKLVSDDKDYYEFMGTHGMNLIMDQAAEEVPEVRPAVTKKEGSAGRGFALLWDASAASSRTEEDTQASKLTSEQADFDRRERRRDRGKLVRKKMVLKGVFSWSQTEGEVVLKVPLKGASLKTVDIYACALYIKVNYRPYLINLDLFDAIDDQSGITRVDDGTLIMRFRKAQEHMWPDLQCANCDDKAAMRKRRTESMEAKSREAAKSEARFKERKMEDERLSTRMQMQVDEMERQRLDDLKAEEKEEAERNVYETLRQFKEAEAEAQAASCVAKENAGLASNNGSDQAEQEKQEKEHLKSILKKKETCPEPRLKDGPHQTEPEKKDERRVSFHEEVSIDGEDQDRPAATDMQNRSKVQDAPSPKAIADGIADAVTEDLSIFSEAELIVESPTEETTTPRDGASDPSEHVETGHAFEADAEADDGDLEKVLPAPRSAAHVTLSFTPRVFPTPMRESKREEEEDWLLRNRRHMKGKVRQRLDAVDISERDPFWLKGKGDDFFRAGNYDGALNAYACALELDPKMTSCLSNRAACFLKLGHNERCIEDCDLALAQIKQERDEEVALADKEGFAQVPKELKRTKDMRKKLHVRKGTALCNMESFTPALTEYQFALDLDPQNEELQADCARLTCLVHCAAQKDLGDEAFRSKAFGKALEHYDKALEYNSTCMPALSNRSACHLKLGNIQCALADCSRALTLTDDTTPVDIKTKLLTRCGALLFKAHDLPAAMDRYKEALELNPSSLEIAKHVKRIEMALAVDPAPSSPQAIKV